MLNHYFPTESSPPGGPGRLRWRRTIEGTPGVRFDGTGSETGDSLLNRSMISMIAAIGDRETFRGESIFSIEPAMFPIAPKTSPVARNRHQRAVQSSSSDDITAARRRCRRGRRRRRNGSNARRARSVSAVEGDELLLHSNYFRNSDPLPASRSASLPDIDDRELEYFLSRAPAKNNHIANIAYFIAGRLRSEHGIVVEDPLTDLNFTHLENTCPELGITWTIEAKQYFPKAQCDAPMMEWPVSSLQIIYSYLSRGNMDISVKKIDEEKRANKRVKYETEELVDEDMDNSTGTVIWRGPDERIRLEDALTSSGGEESGDEVDSETDKGYDAELAALMTDQSEDSHSDDSDDEDSQTDDESVDAEASFHQAFDTLFDGAAKRELPSSSESETDSEHNNAFISSDDDDDESSCPSLPTSDDEDDNSILPDLSELLTPRPNLNKSTYSHFNGSLKIAPPYRGGLGQIDGACDTPSDSQSIASESEAESDNPGTLQSGCIRDALKVLKSDAALLDSILPTDSYEKEEVDELIKYCEEMITFFLRRDYGIMLSENTGHFKGMVNDLPEYGLCYTLVHPRGFAAENLKKLPCSKWSVAVLEGVAWMLERELMKVTVEEKYIIERKKKEEQQLKTGFCADLESWPPLGKALSQKGDVEEGNHSSFFDLISKLEAQSPGAKLSTKFQNLVDAAAKDVKAAQSTSPQRLKQLARLNSDQTPSSRWSSSNGSSSAQNSPKFQENETSDSSDDSSDETFSTALSTSTSTTSSSVSSGSEVVGYLVTPHDDNPDDSRFDDLSREDLKRKILLLSTVVTEQSLDIGERDAEIFEKGHLEKSLSKELATAVKQLRKQEKETTYFSDKLAEALKELAIVKEEARDQESRADRLAGEVSDAFEVLWKIPKSTPESAELQSRVSYLEGELRRQEEINRQRQDYLATMRETFDISDKMHEQISKKDDQIKKLEWEVAELDMKLTRQRADEVLFEQPPEQNDDEMEVDDGDEHRSSGQPPRAPSPPSFEPALSPLPFSDEDDEEYEEDPVLTPRSPVGNSPPVSPLQNENSSDDLLQRYRELQSLLDEQNDHINDLKAQQYNLMDELDDRVGEITFLKGKLVLAEEEMDRLESNIQRINFDDGLREEHYDGLRAKLKEMTRDNNRLLDKVERLMKR